MEKDSRQIGQRLKGLREVLGIPAEDVAELCGISMEHYALIEEGKADPSLYRLTKISKKYGIGLDVLLFGEEPRMKSYFLTRYDKGLRVEQSDDYQYQSLAYGFAGRKIEPFLVTLNPLDGDAEHHKNIHTGQEFDVVVEGELEITLVDKKLTLAKGDSIYFDASKMHSMRALGGQPVKFLCVVI